MNHTPEDAAKTVDQLRLELAECKRELDECRKRLEQMGQAEEELRRGEAYLAQAQKLSRTGSFGWKILTGELVWSDETFCILGYDRSVTPTLELVLKRVHPYDMTVVQEMLDFATHNESDLDFEHRLLMPDQTVKHVHVLARATKAESGATEFVGAVMDITERKQAAEALHASEKLARSQVEALTRTLDALAMESVPDRLVEHVLRTIATQLGAHSCSVWQRVGTSDVIDFQCSFEDGRFVTKSDSVLAGINLRLPMEEFWPWPAVFRTGKPGLMEDIREVPFFPWQERLISLGVITILIVPMSIAARVDAVIGVRFSQKRAFTADELDLAQALANQAMLAMQLTRLSAQSREFAVITERNRSAEALQASEKLARGQVEALKKTLDALATESDPDRLVGHILCAITEQFGAHSSSVWRRDEASGMIGFEFAFEDGKVVPKTDARFAGMDLWLPMEDFWPWPEVFRTGKPSLIEDIRTVPPFALRDRLLKWGIVTVLLVPLFVTGRLEGAIGLRFTYKRLFRAEEVELAQALANQATLAMQLANLYAQSRESAVITERNRMARDIHDTLAQGFTGVIMQLEAAKGATTHGDLAETVNRIERAGELARSSLGEARRSVRALRPRSLSDGKLILAIDDLFKRMTEGTNLNAEFQAEGDDRSIPVDYEEDLLRITQEALTNAVKHANARTFRATLSVSADKVQLRLVDDGRGFDPQIEHEGFGLIGMKERVDRMGGEFIIRAKPDVGTELLVELKSRSALKREVANEES